MVKKHTPVTGLRRMWSLALVMALALAVIPPARPVQAATYTVNSTDDVDDGACNWAHCSLREAIKGANGSVGADTIGFSIGGCGGVCTILPGSPLPALTNDRTTIDGYSQPGATEPVDMTPATILIEIYGADIVYPADGLTITSGKNVIKGLRITGFTRNGIVIRGGSAKDNIITGNHIGTYRGGNSQSGVYIYDGAQRNIVGGDTNGKRNVISGNGWHGVRISGSGTVSNTVAGNYIGTDIYGSGADENGIHGVYVSAGAQNNSVGSDPFKRNVISGNIQDGVRIEGSDTTGNVVSNNYIGLHRNGGLASIPNGGSGVGIRDGAHNNTVGGDTAGDRNVIAGNDNDGVSITGSGTTGNIASGNYIGVVADGMGLRPNGLSGVQIYGGARSNTVGGDTEGERNVIAGNQFYGVYIRGSGTMSNTVSGNYIGLLKDGATGAANGDYGVYIGDAAQNNIVGGDTAGERNVISKNGRYGVLIVDSGTMGNTVSGNYIGTDFNGTADQGNGWIGVRISEGAQNNTVGGDTAGERNIISGNDEDGVAIDGSGTTGNVVSGNYIGLDKNGTADLGNTSDGVDISSGAQNNTVGGDTAGERNVISGNNEYGVYIGGSSTMSNTVFGNYIGADFNGTADRGNTSDGVRIWLGAQNNTVGGDTAGERNVISGNGGSGVYIYSSGTMTNTVSGNYIGTDFNGTADLGNTSYGVYIGNSAKNNTVGPGNVIAYNDLDGVAVDGNLATGNAITQNSIFSNSMGIELMWGANGSIRAPVIVTTTVGSVNIVGTVRYCPGCTVEVFENRDADGEGETYVGNATVTAGGDFTVTVSYLSQPYLTATATDARGTSEFSAVFTATIPLGFHGLIYLPIVLTNP